MLTCIGDAGGFHYKKSRRGNAEVDRAAAHVLRHYSDSPEILDFSPYGYDERQYCSPGFNLPIGCLMRSVWGTFPEYHTSADNLDFIRPSQLAGSLRVCAAILDVLEHNRRYRNQSPYGEPQLGRRNLYRSTGGDAIGAGHLGAPVGVEPVRWGALAAGHRGALRHAVRGDQRRRGVNVPEPPAVMIISSFFTSSAR